MLVLMCKEEAHVKRNLLTKQLAIPRTQVLKRRTLKDHVSLIIKSTCITSAANPLKAADTMKTACHYAQGVTPKLESDHEVSVLVRQSDRVGLCKACKSERATDCRHGQIQHFS